MPITPPSPFFPNQTPSGPWPGTGATWTGTPPPGFGGGGGGGLNFGANFPQQPGFPFPGRVGRRTVVGNSAGGGGGGDSSPPALPVPQQVPDVGGGEESRNFPQQPGFPFPGGFPQQIPPQFLQMIPPQFQGQVQQGFQNPFFTQLPGWAGYLQRLQMMRQRRIIPGIPGGAPGPTIG